MWAVLTALAGLALPAQVIQGLVWLVACTVVATMFQYVIVWGTRARNIVARRDSRS